MRGLWLPILLAISVVPAARAQGRATLVGWIKDSLGTPVDRADVSIDGKNVSTRTDSLGQFTLRGLDAGSATIRIRRLGFDPQTFEFDLRASRTDTVAVTLETSPRLLEGIRTEAVRGRRIVALADFHKRRGQGSGFFVTREELEQAQANVLSEYLRRFPGLRLVRSGTTRTTLRFPSSSTKRYDCPPQYWVDGRRVTRVEIDDFPVTDIEGIELYSNSSTTPVQFSQGTVVACGTVVIWTRVPGKPNNDL